MPEGKGELGWIWGRKSEAPTFRVSPLGLTALRGYGYTHFTGDHTGAKVSDLLKIDSWDSMQASTPEPAFTPTFPRPHAASCRQPWAAWQAWRVRKGVRGGAREPGRSKE